MHRRGWGGWGWGLQKQPRDRLDGRRSHPDDPENVPIIPIIDILPTPHMPYVLSFATDPAPIPHQNRCTEWGGWGAYRSSPETASTDAEVAQLAAAARSGAAANHVAAF